MKKFLTVLCLALLLSLVCATALAAVPDTYKLNGKPLNSLTTYAGATVTGVISTKAPTCDESTGAGEAIIQTTAGNYIVAIDPLDHTWSVIGVASDCVEQTIYKQCDLCGKTETELRKTGGSHSWSLVPTPGYEPTCTATGEGTWQCTVCGKPDPERTTPEEIPMLPHIFSVVVVDTPETCLTAGQSHKECSMCGLEQRNTADEIIYTIIPKHAFSYDAASVTVIKPATCKEAGQEYRYCGKCGLPALDELGAQKIFEIPKLEEHSWGAWDDTYKPATCAPGLSMRECAVCGLQETKTLPAIYEHTYVEKNTYTESACRRAADGIHAASTTKTTVTICSVCGNQKGAATTTTTYDQHSFIPDPYRAGDAYNREPECAPGGGTVPGVRAMICANCGGIYDQIIPLKNMHSWSGWVADGANVWVNRCTNKNCTAVEYYYGSTAPSWVPDTGYTEVPSTEEPTTNPPTTTPPTTTPPTTTPPTTTPPSTTTPPAVAPEYKITSWNYAGNVVSGQVHHVQDTGVLDNLYVRITLYSNSNSSFIVASVKVDSDGKFEASLGGDVYAISMVLTGDKGVAPGSYTSLDAVGKKYY